MRCSFVIFYYLYFRNHCFSIERRIIKSDKYCSKSGRIYYGTNFCYTYFHGIFFRTNKDIFQIIGIIKRKECRGTTRSGGAHSWGSNVEEQGHIRNIISITILDGNIPDPQTTILNQLSDQCINNIMPMHFYWSKQYYTYYSFGLLMDNPIFRIPAAASIVLLIAILIVLTGAFYYWMGPWKLIFLYLLFYLWTRWCIPI